MSREHVGHRAYDKLLVGLLDEVASYRLREELLDYFCKELFQLSSCDIMMTIENYGKDDIRHQKDIHIFNLLDRNRYRDIKQNIQNGDFRVRYNPHIFDKLKEVKSNAEALNYQTSNGFLDFMLYLIPQSEYKKEGWINIVYLPRATPKHPERFLILWYKGFKINQVPDTLSQDERVLYLFRHYYKLASFNIKNKAKLIYEQRMELVKALVPSMISHEVFHKVSTISAYKDILLEDIQELNNTQSLEKIKEISAEIIEDIDDILTPSLTSLKEITGAISKLTKQSTSEEINISHVLKESILLMETIASRLGINIRLHSFSDINIQSDRALFMHLIMNLISNSVEAYKDVQISPKVIAIQVENSSKNKNIDIYISDNAKGVDSDIKDKLFEEGFSTKNEGNGLGLSICKFIVGFLGGTIELSYYKSYKTTFKISLPKDAFKFTTLNEETK